MNRKRHVQQHIKEKQNGTLFIQMVVTSQNKILNNRISSSYLQSSRFNQNIKHNILNEYKNRNYHAQSQSTNYKKADRESKTAYPDQPVLRLILFCIFHRIINQPKSGRFPAPKMGAELEDKDGILILHLIHTCQLLLQLRLYNEVKNKISEKGIILASMNERDQSPNQITLP